VILVENLHPIDENLLLITIMTVVAAVKSLLWRETRLFFIRRDGYEKNLA
jgi:hypothetical protein